MRVGIVGTGELADALATLCRAAQAEIVVGPRGAEHWTVQPDLAALVAESDLTLLVVPGRELRLTVKAMAPGPAARVVVATRGLEPGTGRRFSEIVREESACLRVGVLAGPILPGEVRRGSPCAAVVASAFDEVAKLAMQALTSPMCRVYPSHDVAGVETAGALVEVLAIAFGVARGLGLGVGAQAMIVTRGIAEGARLASRQEGDARTFAGLAGVGELVVSANLPDHPAHLRGLALARGVKDPDAVLLCDALLARERDMPITAAVRALAMGEAKASKVLAGLMAREFREEFDA
ncbi:MAG: hypothetical protein ACOZNI_26870 [Myxococcota bacterium]